MKPELTLDIETTGKNPWDSRLICLGWQADDLRDGETVVDVGRMSPVLTEALADPDRPVVCHSTFDIRYLRLEGYTVLGPVYDSMVMAHRLDENTPLSLAWCAEKYSDVYKDERLVRRGGRLFFRCDDGDVCQLEDAPLDEVVEYNARDVRVTKMLFLRLKTKLQRSGLYDDWLGDDVPLTSAVINMEVNGMPIDLDDNERLRNRLSTQRAVLREELYREGELPSAFNINSGDQVAAFLFLPEFDLPGRVPLEEARQHGFRPLKLGRKWATGTWPVKGLKLVGTRVKEDPKTGKRGSRPPVDTDSLLVTHGANPWVKKLIEWRKLDTLLTNYIEKFSRVAVNEWGETYDQNLQRLSRGIRPEDRRYDISLQEVDGEPILLSRMRSSSAGGGDGDTDVPLLPRDWRTQECSSDDYGAGSRTETSKERSCSPHQPRQDGQSSREPCRVDDIRASSGTSLGFRLYGRFSQTGTKTGRLSSREPNMQNIPVQGELGRQVRDLFRGSLIVGDFSQLEPRLMAHFSGDPVLTDIYRKGEDVYIRIASEVLEQSVLKTDPERAVFKVFVLALGYGAGPRRLAANLSAEGYPTTQREAADTLSRLESVLGGFFAWKDDVVDFATRRGYVETVGGRRRHLVFDYDNYITAGYAARQAANSVIQGSAADIVDRVMIKTDNITGLKLLAQIHDELVWEYDPIVWNETNMPRLISTLKAVAERGHGFDLNVPLVFDVNVVESWAGKGG